MESTSADHSFEQLELTPQPRSPIVQEIPTLEQEDIIDRNINLGFVNRRTAILNEISSEAAVAADLLPEDEPVLRKRTWPRNGRGRKSDGSVDRRTLSSRGRRAADRPAPNYFPYKK